MKPISSDEFFKLLAVNSGISDLSTIKNVYYGMVKTISRELKNKQVVRLPDWGDFVLKIYKSRKYKMTIGDRREITLPAKPLIKFLPNYAVKHYFYKFGEDRTVI